MNKIPFTSQNPYAFYAKTIDSYDTETNTREAKKGKKEQVFSKGDSFTPVFKWETPVLVTYSFDEASKFHHFECCLLQCDCAAMQCCRAPAPRTLALGLSTHT